MSENNPEVIIPEIVTTSNTGNSQVTPTKKHRNGLFWPVILILAGIFLLLQNLHLLTVNLNWWAAFIFIPVVGSITGAISAFRKSGRFDMAVRSAIGSAIVVGTVATMFLFDMDWSRWWPLMLVAPGASMVLSGFYGTDNTKHRTMADWTGLNVWFGIAVMMLGAGFLVKMLPITSLEPLLDGYRWWAIPILFAGIGAFVSALIVCIRSGMKMGWTVWAFSGIGVAVTATGLFALFNLNWNLLSPIILIAAGIVVLSGILIKK